MAKGAYIGIDTDIPIYSEEIITITSSNVDTYFTVTNHSDGGFQWSGDTYVSDPSASNDDFIESHWSPKVEGLMISFDYDVSSEENFDIFRFDNPGHQTPNNGMSASGTKTGTYPFTAVSGYLCFIYEKDDSNSTGRDGVTLSNIRIKKTTQIGTETKSVARKVKQAYIGVDVELPVYGGEEIIQITSSNVSNYFTVTRDDYYFTWSGNNLVSEGIDHSESAMITLKAKSDIYNISFDYAVSSESGYDFLVILLGNNLIVKESGEKSGSWSGSISAGSSLSFTYTKDSSSDSGSDKATISNISIKSKVQTGTEIKSVAKRVKRAYVGDSNNKARLWMFEGVTWRKWSCDYSERSETWYEEVNSDGMHSIGDTATVTWGGPTWYGCTDYGFSRDEGYYAIDNSKVSIEDMVGMYDVSSDSVILVLDMVPTGGDWYDVTWEYVALAKGYYYPATYSKGSIDCGTVYAQDGDLPESGTLVKGSASDSYCVVEVDGTYYYYEKL